MKVRHQRPVVSARATPDTLPERLQQYLADGHASVAQPFKGITAGGEPVRGLFPIAPTGISAQPIREAAERFLAGLGGEQRRRVSFPVDDDAWRRWSNIHPHLMRHGVPLEELTPAQRERGLALLAACLSERGFTTVRDVMKLNEFIGEVTGRWEEYGQWLYWLSVMGTPSASEPWGWQIDGHHLIVNCFVLGDQLVMTPTFLGSEPVLADRGQQEGLLDLLDVYVGRMRPGHAAVRMDEVRRHLSATWFAWMGGADEESVFYYRIHNPVILVEFDHQRGIALDNDQPSRDHIHTVVRTPNGNDYGKDLLRQHYERFDHARGAHDPRR